ncbi:MAG: hypothetical protein ACYSSO_09845, partial [Planctomycetota bacterium]
MPKFDEKEIQRRAELLSQIQPNSEATGRAIERVRDTLINKAKAKEHPDTGIWQTIMNSRVTKFAAAAAIIIVAALAITLLQQSATPAYAIDQTIEASRDIRYLYFEWYSSSEDEPSKECWVEFDEAGQPQKIRVNMYKHWGGSQITHVWKEEQAIYWQKDANTLELFSRCQPHTEMMLRLVRQCDPKTAVQSLYDRQLNNDVTIEIKEPLSKDEPIVIEGTFLPGRYIPNKPTLPSFRDVLYVDQETKLVTALEVYELKEGEYKYNGVWKYQDYDQPFDSTIFSLEDEVPQGVMHIEVYCGDDVNDVGLKQGAFTDEEIAFKVVCQFFEALIDKDYAKAGQLFGGMPANEAEEKFSHLNVSRIVSISEPVKSEKPSSLRVPCTIEIESDGGII